ncbi:MAG: hypothetical protein WC364_05825 [Eubacteriales bacterium]|jgi:ERCC4-type nuclease
MIFRDVFEPQTIHDLIAQTIPVTKANLNHELGIADYYWYCWDDHRTQVERKQIDEILSNLDAVEELLSRELSNDVEETILLIEGDCEPIPGVKSFTQSWKLGKGGKIMVPGHKYALNYKRLQAWLFQLSQAGVVIVRTPHYLATAFTLVALYESSQSEEHGTLNRIIKDKIRIKDVNPHIITLMGIRNGGVGEEIATALINRYGTACYTLSRDLDELADTMIGDKRLGIIRAKKLLKAFGRQV